MQLTSSIGVLFDLHDMIQVGDIIGTTIADIHTDWRFHNHLFST